MLYLNHLFSKYLLIVKRFGSLREKRQISVHHYYYYYYYLFIIIHVLFFVIIIAIAIIVIKSNDLCLFQNFTVKACGAFLPLVD